jgi:hypothetical protein
MTFRALAVEVICLRLTPVKFGADLGANLIDVD